MFRYVGLIWNDAEAAARSTAERLCAQMQAGHTAWKLVTKNEGLIVLCCGAKHGSSEPRLLQDGAGVVLGRLFTRSLDGAPSTAAPSSFAANQTAQIVATGGRHLVHNYWGRYVAFLHDRSTGTMRVLRDPSGGMPCLNFSVAGVEVFFSRMDDGAQLASRPFTINWNWLISLLAFQRIESGETGLNEVTQVVCGECVELQHGQKSRVHYWDPLRIADSQLIVDPQQAASAVRQTLLDVVQAWASGYESIIHTLSGGLDSSLVLTCLKHVSPRPRITCVNYYSAGSNTDERNFARIAAQRAGFELVEMERDPALHFEVLHTVPLSASPPNWRYSLENSRNEARLAQDKQASALFSGEGGDQLFYQARTVFAAADYWYRRGLLRGLNSGLLNAALDAARVDRVSIWKVLGVALKHQLFGERWSPRDDLGRFRTLIPTEMVEAARQYANAIHPLFQAPYPAPSGKLWHGYQLVFPQDFYDQTGGFPDGLERVTPILSQPMVELCMRIPTDVLITGGWDRAIARRAFQHDAPREIITRKTKGGVDEYTKTVLYRNMPFIRDLLLDGWLVREKIVDRAKLDEVLSPRPTRIASGTVELYDFVGTETWLRRWIGVPPASQAPPTPSP